MQSYKLLGMDKKLIIADLISLERVLEKLSRSDLMYDIDTAVKIIRVKKRVNEIVEYTFSRLDTIYGGNVDFNNLSEQHRLVYETIMTQKATIYNYGLKLSDVSKNSLVAIDLQEAEILCKVFD